VSFNESEQTERALNYSNGTRIYRSPGPVRRVETEHGRPTTACVGMVRLGRIKYFFYFDKSAQNFTRTRRLYNNRQYTDRGRTYFLLIPYTHTHILKHTHTYILYIYIYIISSSSFVSSRRTAAPCPFLFSPFPISVRVFSDCGEFQKPFAL
jgi:hypothetical protein